MGRAGVDELAPSEIDADVRYATISIEENEVAGPWTAQRRPANVVLSVGGSRQFDAEQSEDVLNEARAIKAGGCRAAENVRDAEEAKRAAGQALSDPRGSGKNSAGETLDPVMMPRLGGNDQPRRPFGDIGAQCLGIGAFGSSKIIDLGWAAAGSGNCTGTGNR